MTIDYLATSDSFMLPDGSIHSAEWFNSLRTAMNLAWVERAASRGECQIIRDGQWWPEAPSRKAEPESILGLLGLAPKQPQIQRRRI